MKKALKRWELWVSAIILTIASGLLIFAICYTVNVGRKLSSYTHIDATVIDYKLETEGPITHRRSYDFTVVEYKVDGVTYRATDKASALAKGKVGSLVKIAYNPDDPAECVFVRSEKSLMSFLFIFATLLAAMGTAIATVFVKDLKREKLMNTYANAKFVTSAASKAQFISCDKPVIAVCGKSNVGKSSFINMLANQRHLAKVSGEPGRTRLVNYFDFGTFMLADLPGYGYAKVSKAETAKWGKLLDDFFNGGKGVTHVFALCDIRHEPTADDKVMLNFLYESMIPFTVIATKADKLSKAQTGKAIATIATSYTVGRDAIIPTSAKTRLGFEKVVEEIDKVIGVYRERQSGSIGTDDADATDGQDEE